MNITVANSEPHNIKKRIFTLKPVKKNGLILQIHNTNVQYSTSQKRNVPLQIRFINMTFDICGKIFATSDVQGNVFIIDFNQEKYWLLPNLETCSVLKFSSLNSQDLLIGRQNGQILILDIHSGVIHTVWEDHKDAVKNITFSGNKCLTWSIKEAIIYNLNNFKKIHALYLQDYAKLNYVVFTPVHSYILTCFADSYINVWESKTFKSIRQILPTTWKKRLIRCFAFTRNGQLMVLAGKSNFLLVFSFVSWTLERTLTVPLNLRAIKQIDFIPQDHDGGANRIIAILSSDGVLYMYDMDFNFILNETRLEGEISSFEVSPFGHTIACILHSGEVNFYKTSILIKNYFVQAEGEYRTQQKLKIYLPQPKQITDIMDTNKLRSILLEYGEFPVTYRTTIWSKILKLPNNRQCFASVINCLDEDFFSNLENEYPMINKRSLKCLKRTLNNIAVWCPFFTKVDFLPLFIFPFVKIYENDPILAFECAITVLMNWCQHWFENTPVPPINILAIIENLLFQHDPQLLQHYRLYNITSVLYGWTLLEVAFSEVLTISEWQILWDHIITNEPSFFLYTPVAYNIINRTIILNFTKLEEFELFFHSQNPISFKRFIWKIYNLNDLTTDDIHPRQYLDYFTPLTKPEYPVFIQYTQTNETHRMSAGGDDENSTTPASLKPNLKNQDSEKHLEDLKLNLNEVQLEDPKSVNDLEADVTKNAIPFSNADLTEKPKKSKKRLSVILSHLDELNDYQEKDLNRIQEKIEENVEKLLAQRNKLQEIINDKKIKAQEGDKTKKNISRNTVTYKTYVSKSTSPVIISEALRKKYQKNQKSPKNPEKNQRLLKNPNKKLSKLERITVELEKQVQQLLEKQMQEANSTSEKTKQMTSITKPRLKSKKHRKTVKHLTT